MDLFDDLPVHPDAATTPIGQGAELLQGFARNNACALLKAVESVLPQTPLRQLQITGGHTMSVSMSNCGSLDWVSSQARPVIPACGVSFWRSQPP